MSINHKAGLIQEFVCENCDAPLPISIGPRNYRTHPDRKHSGPIHFETGSYSEVQVIKVRPCEACISAVTEPATALKEALQVLMADKS